MDWSTLGTTLVDDLEALAQDFHRLLHRPTAIDQLDALETLMRSDIPREFRAVCHRRYLEMTDRPTQAAYEARP